MKDTLKLLKLIIEEITQSAKKNNYFPCYTITQNKVLSERVYKGYSGTERAYKRTLETHVSSDL